MSVFNRRINQMRPTWNFWSCKQWLYNVHRRLETLAKLSILRPDALIVLDGSLEIEEGLLRREVAHLLFQSLNVRLGALADCALRLAVVGPFLGQLIGGQVGDAS